LYKTAQKLPFLGVDRESEAMLEYNLWRRSLLDYGAVVASHRQSALVSAPER